MILDPITALELGHALIDGANIVIHTAEQQNILKLDGGAIIHANHIDDGHDQAFEVMASIMPE